MTALTVVAIDDLNKGQLATRSTFSCGVPSLDSYLSKTARQHTVKNICKTYCLVDSVSNGIIGYVSINVASILLDAKVKKSLPANTEIPVVRLCRLAVDSAHQDKGYGKNLLYYALEHAVSVAGLVGAVGVVVDAIDVKAADFYKDHGFEPMPCKPLFLFLEINNLKKTLSDSSSD